jgi:hypothetical protein
MPMIDVYAAADLFPAGSDRALAQELTAALLRAEGVANPGPTPPRAAGASPAPRSAATSSPRSRSVRPDPALAARCKLATTTSAGSISVTSAPASRC